MLCLLVQVPNCTVLEKRTVIYFLCSEGVNSSELYSRPSAEVYCPARFFGPGEGSSAIRCSYCYAIRQLKFANFSTHPIYIYIYIYSGPNPSDYHMFHHKSSLWLTKIFPVMTKFRTRCIIGFEDNGKFLLRWGPGDL